MSTYVQRRSPTQTVLHLGRYSLLNENELIEKYNHITLKYTFDRSKYIFTN